MYRLFTCSNIIALVIVARASSVRSNYNYRQVYYVRPTPTSDFTFQSNPPCPFGVPCFELAYYLQHQEQYFTSDTIFIFMEGEHKLLIHPNLTQFDNTVVICNVRNLTLVGSSSVNLQSWSFESDFKEFTTVSPTTRIICNIDTIIPSALVFVDVYELKLENIAFTNCGRKLRVDNWNMIMDGLDTNFLPSVRLRPPVAVVLSKVRNLMMRNVLIKNSMGYGLVGINLYGNSVLHDSSFTHNNQVNSNTPTNYYGGNAFLLYINNGRECDYHIKYIDTEHNILISHSQFFNGLGRGFVPLNNHSLLPNTQVWSFVGGGGLTVLTTPADYFVNVTIKDVIVANNSASLKVDGTNLWIIVHDKVNSVHFDIQNIVALHIPDHHSTISELTSVGYTITPLASGGCQFDNFERSKTQKLKIKTSQFSHNSVALKVMIRAIVSGHTVIEIEHSTFWNNGVHLQIATVEEFSQFIYIVNFQHFRAHIWNCTFANSSIRYSLTPSIRLQTVKMISFDECQFRNNLGTALDVYNSNILFIGNATFTNNTGYNGGAIALRANSHMYTGIVIIGNPNYSIMFVNNHAVRCGGAIYISNGGEEQLIRVQNRQITCSFLTITCGHLCDTTITLENNTAEVAGSAMFGAVVENCNWGQGIEKNNIITESDKEIFDRLFDVIPSSSDDLSVITSDPFDVVRCKGGKTMSPNNTSKIVSVEVYPGELFTVEVGAAGRGGGLAPGTISSRLVNSTALLGPLQQVQDVKSKCKNLTYNIFTDGYDYLETMDIYVSDFANYFSNTEGRHLTVDIFIKECPPGFKLSTGTNPSCVCEETLQSLNVSCDINSQTFTRFGTIWIHGYPLSSEHNMVTDMYNLTVSDIVVHEHCPFDYCNQNSITFNLSDPDSQCTNGRSGVLCGACKKGLSLTLGDGKCAPCSNSYLALVIPFAVLGVVVVIILTALNLTVSVGAMNGLIFFANVVQFNRAAFFSANLSPFETFLSVFVAWLNLDFGINSCFYASMDAYVLTWLEFAFPVYLWIIVGILIILSKRFHIVVRLLGRNAVKVLATLFLLSYTKLLRTITAILSYTTIQYPTGESSKVWLYDGNVMYSQGKHIPLLVVALGFVILYIIPYTLLLLLIPVLQANSGQYCFRWVNEIMPFLDAYQGPYKNRYRFWTGLMLLVRVFTFISFTISFGDVSINLFTTTTVVVLILSVYYFIEPVYKCKIVSTLELFFLLNLGILSSASLLVVPNHIHKQTYITSTMVTLAFCGFMVIIVYHIYLKCDERYHCDIKIPCFKTNQPEDEEEQDPVICEDYSITPTTSVVQLSAAIELKEPLLDVERKKAITVSNNNPVANVTRQEQKITTV